MGKPRQFVECHATQAPTFRSDGMRRLEQRIYSIAGTAFIVALLASAPLRAQQSPTDQSPTMQDAAARISAAIVHSKVKRVVVFDFVGPVNNNVTLLGRNLADQFSGMLAASSPKLKVEDRSQIDNILNKKRYSQDALLYPETAGSVAKDLKAQELIWGSLSSESGGVKISLCLKRVSSGPISKVRSDWKDIESAEVLLRFSDQLNELLGQVVLLDPLARHPLAGEAGYSDPACVVCPAPAFTNEAVQDQIQGTVLLRVVVSLFGDVEAIAVVQGLPDGLTEQAIQTVREWRLKPSKGPDGKPAMVQALIQIEFHLSR